MDNSFYFIKKINNQWVENIEVLNQIKNYYDDRNKIREKNQSRKCTDFFRIHLINLPSEYKDEIVEELKYKMKMALIKLIYQKNKNKIFNFAKKIEEIAERFIDDLEKLQKENSDENKLIILKKLIKAFKNSLNQIYIINYA